MQNAMRESPPFSKEEPLVLDRQLQRFTASNLQTFLNHLYLGPELGSASEAYALIKVADMFDAASL